MIVAVLGWVEIRACQHFLLKPTFARACNSSTTICYGEKKNNKEEDVKPQTWRKKNLKGRDK